MTELSPETIQRLIPFGLYFLSILGIGATVLIVALMRWQAAGHPRVRQLAPWVLRPLDIGIFACGLVWAYTVANGLAIKLPGGPQVAGVLGTIAMQFGLAAVVIGSYRYLGPSPRAHINTHPLSLRRAVLTGALAMLGALPLILLVNAGWATLLSVLESLGLPIELVKQPAIDLILGLKSPWLIALMLTSAVLFAPLAEELVFRAGIYRLLRRGLPFWASAVISSLLFAGVHFYWQGLPGLFLVGFCLAAVYEYTGDIRASMAFHAAFNLNSVVMLFLIPPELL